MPTKKAKRDTSAATAANARNRLMSQFEKTGLLRPVTEVDLKMPNGELVPNKKAIIYADDESYISTVGHRYTVIQNEQVMNKLAIALSESGLKLKGCSVDPSTSATNARNLIRINLPEHKIETSKGDTTALQIVARNSYDGSWKQMLDIGGFRMACANGQVWGDIDNICTNRHTAGYDVAMMAEYLSHAIDVFKEMGAQWLTMKKTKLSQTKAEDLILQYLGKKFVDKEDRARILTSERSTLVQSMMESWVSHKAELGTNVFALYNTLTAHATHTEDVTSPADASTILGKRVVQTLQPYLRAA